jgi:hypothetical protein
MNASQLIDKQIADLRDWRGKVLTKIRKVIHDADPEIIEEWKWDTGIFSDNGVVCAIAAFKDHVKINFFSGASIEDNHKLFNAGMESKKSRAIDLKESDKIKEDELKDLVRSAVSNNKVRKRKNLR